MNRTVTDNPAGSLVPLTGIVLAREPARCIRIRTWLEARHSAVSLHIAADARAMNRALCLGNIDFVISVVADGSSTVPAALRRVPHVHTLVLVESASIGALPDWLYQGADAVCSLRDTDALCTALDTLIEVCTLRRRLTLLRRPGSRQSAMLRGLMSAQAATPSILANGARLTLRPELADTTHPLIDDTGTVDIPSLRSWQASAIPPRTAAREPGGSGPTYRRLQSAPGALVAKRQAVRQRRSMKGRLRERSARIAERDARILQAEPRQQIEQRLEQLLAKRPEASACAAMRLNFTRPGWQDTTSRWTPAPSVDWLEVGVGRAARTLSQHFDHATLLARPGSHCLLLLRQAQLFEQAYISANRVRELLGTLGGLIGSSRSIRIQTLNVATFALSLSELLAWVDEGW